MKPMRPKDQITRRKLLEVSSIASAGVLASGNAAMPASALRKRGAGENDSTLIAGEIALEEHFALPETVGDTYAASRSWTAAAGWFDNAAISEADRVKIGRTNAQKLFRL